jgi:hypothetical protein
MAGHDSVSAQAREGTQAVGTRGRGEWCGVITIGNTVESPSFSSCPTPYSQHIVEALPTGFVREENSFVHIKVQH